MLKINETVNSTVIDGTLRAMPEEYRPHLVRRILNVAFKPIAEMSFSFKAQFPDMVKFVTNKANVLKTIEESESGQFISEAVSDKMLRIF